MTSVRASPFQKHREPTISHAQRPAVDKMSHLLHSKQPKPAVLSHCLAFCYPADRLIGLRNVGRRSQLGSGEMAKHKPYKFACSTLRHEGPALRKCNTKNPKPSKKPELTKSRRSKPKYRKLIESLIGGKPKTPIAKDENKTWKHTRTVAASHA